MPSRADQPITGRKLGDAEQVTVDALALEAELAELGAQYEQYFLGIERRPPTKKHEAFKKKVERLKTTVVRQVAAKFRVQTLTNKVLTFERLWDRTIKEIEAGTYKRDVMRARRHEAERKKRRPDAPAENKADEVEELDLDDLDIDEAPDVAPAPAAAPAVVSPAAGVPGVARIAPVVSPLTTPAKPVPQVQAAAAAKPGAAAAPPRASPTVPAARPSSPPPPSTAQAAGGAQGLSDQKIRAIYDAYLTAKKRCGEDTSSLNYASVADTLRKQVPALMKQHNAKSVEFKVVIKDGKAVLRALPKE